ncbi:choloylglycine hydrolase [Photobacterium leiognathi subsp. mandapamensis]|nr:choloylglycine hydrolase [Photobacterium leiognathi subsp. mandapamensis]
MCTGIILHSEDGVTIPARTMEFGFNIQSNIAIVPAGTQISSLSSDELQTGLVYKAKYGFGGLNGLGRNIIVDGMNEKGLYFGAFYFAGFAQYSELSPENQSQSVSSEELGNYILANFATVDEVREGLNKVTVVGTFIKEIQNFAPLHYSVVDANGGAIVIEYSEKGLTIFDNEIGVMTNPPSFDWHMTHIRNYIGLSTENVKPVAINNNVTLTALSQGSGLMGLPGDYTSPSRFLRAAAFVNLSIPSKSVDEGVFHAFHILNAFDIPKGLVSEVNEHGVFNDYTIWTSVADTRNKDYYFRTYLSPQQCKINIVEALEGLDAPKVIEMESSHHFQDLTSLF